MKLTNPKYPVKASWLRELGHRLDAPPFLSGAIEARKTLERLAVKKQNLVDLTRDGMSGMYHVGQDKIRWVEDPELGVPFLRSSDILKADLSESLLISRRQVAENPLFQCPPGTTLITRSGTIGRTVYVRREMADMAVSQDVLKVVPDSDKVPPGYLYAYLSSKFGVPQIISGTFGSIIVHIEAENIANLKVPRLGKAVEENVHNLVQSAADLRSEGSEDIRHVVCHLQSAIRLPPLSNPDPSRFCATSVRSGKVDGRLDAYYHSLAAQEAESAVMNCGVSARLLRDITKRLFKPPIFRRLWVESAAYGRQFISGNDAYRYSATEARYVSTKTPGFNEFLLKPGWMVFQAAGQVYGLFGRPLYVRGWLEETFCADDMYRVVPFTDEDGAYLFAFFKTPHGRVLLKRQACGNSIPRVWDPHMARVIVPWPSERERNRLAETIIRAHDKIEQARVNEVQAVELVESTVQAMGNS